MAGNKRIFGVFLFTVLIQISAMAASAPFQYVFRNGNKLLIDPKAGSVIFESGSIKKNLSPTSIQRFYYNTDRRPGHDIEKFYFMNTAPNDINGPVVSVSYTTMTQMDMTIMEAGNKFYIISQTGVVREIDMSGLPSESRTRRDKKSKKEFKEWYVHPEDTNLVTIIFPVSKSTGGKAIMLASADGGQGFMDVLPDNVVWTYDSDEKKFFFKDDHNQLIGELEVGALFDTKSSRALALPPPNINMSPGKFENFLESTRNPLAKFITEILTDTVRHSHMRSNFLEIKHRDKLTLDLMNQLARTTSRLAFVVGEQGSGKRTLIENLANKILHSEFPKTPEFINAFENAEIIVVEPAALSDPAVFFEAVAHAQGMFEEQYKSRKPVIVYINNANQFAQTNIPDTVLNEILEAAGEHRMDTRIIISVSPEEEKEILKGNSFAKAYFNSQKPLRIPKLTDKETFDVLKESWSAMISKKYEVSFSDEGLEAIVERSKELRAGTGQPEAAILLMQDVAIAQSHGADKSVDKAAVLKYMNTIKPVARNPLEDKETVQKILNLSEELKKEIKGQDEVVKDVSELVINHLSKSKKKMPLSFMLVGSTGTGKTEFGKALAKALYGSKDKASVIALGGILEISDVSEIFGSKPGYIGMDTEREFEKALKRSPEGGVIVFDEASNMGGADKAKKDALFKKFYDLVYEGKWTSSVDGTVYDLTNYIFVFTGNDGDKLFVGIDSDDIRTSTWNENKSKPKVKSILMESGVPEPFLGRLAATLLMKPLVEKVKEEISTKFLNEKKAELESEYPGVKVTYTEEFLKQVSKSFYSHSEGARSLGKFFENRFGSLVTDAIIHYGKDENGLVVNPEKIKGLEIKLGIDDNKSWKTYLLKSSTRKVEISVDLYKGKKKVESVKSDVTADAAPVILSSGESAIGTGVHEMGHAALNSPELTGRKLAHITVVGGRDGRLTYLGYARYEQLEMAPNITKASVIARVAQAYGGSKAQEIAGIPLDSGWSEDLRQIKDYVGRAVLKFGFEKELLGVEFDKDGEPIMTPAQREIYEAKKLEYIQMGEKVAEKVLRANWPLVRNGTANLVKKGFITGADFETIKQYHVATSKMPSLESQVLDAVSEQLGTTARTTKKVLRCVDGMAAL